MRLNISHRRYCFVAIYPLAVRDGLFTRASVHDSVFNFSHQLIHSWPRDRSSAIRNLRPARLPQLGDFETISQVPQPRIGKENLKKYIFGVFFTYNLLSLEITFFN